MYSILNSKAAVNAIAEDEQSYENKCWGINPEMTAEGHKNGKGAFQIKQLPGGAHVLFLTWLFLVGIVVFLLMSLVNTPPSVSIPRERGVTSKSSTSVTSPANTPPWIAAPIATASSGFTALLCLLYTSPSPRD